MIQLINTEDVIGAFQIIINNELDLDIVGKMIQIDGYLSNETYWIELAQDYLLEVTINEFDIMFQL